MHLLASSFAALSTLLSLATTDLHLAHLPARPDDAPTGTEFGVEARQLSDHDRYLAARDQILAGNVPDFLREMVPVTLERPASAGPGPERVTVFVTPDYLAVGTDQDFLNIPLDFVTASEVARKLGYGLPTTRIVDAIYREAQERVQPVPLPAGPEMRSMAYILEHRTLVSSERAGLPLGPLIAGTHKDVVLTGQLRQVPGHEAIYGWHRMDGHPIQPLSLVHGVGYADYSHGIRLVDRTVLVDGVARDYFDALSDPAVAPILSSEGAIRDPVALLSLPTPAGYAG